MLKSKIDFDKVRKRVLSDKLPLMGNSIIRDIIVRTQRGLDVNLRTFKRYSKDYLDYRIEKGRSRMPNLTFTGNMLNSINYKKIQGGIRLFFNSIQQNDKAWQNNRDRHFFGVDKKMRKKIKRFLLKNTV